ncbi:MAG: hypothetical protein KAT68_11735 [Bacteroidales bacterium]|nr:hypothetical protein [Bacteroidales bacterium]
MRKLFLLSIIILVLKGSILSQKPYSEKVNFDYIRLPKNPLPKDIVGYSGEVVLSYEEEVINAKKVYEEAVIDAKKESESQKQEYKDKSLGNKIVNKALLNEGKPTDIKVENEYFAKIYDIEMIKNKYLQIPGLEISDDSKCKIIIDLKGFQIGDIEEKVKERKRKKDDKTITINFYKYAINHKHPMSVSVATDDYSFTLDETFTELEEYKTSYTSEYPKKYDLQKYWKTNKIPFLTKIDEKQTHGNLAKVSGFLKSNFGHTKMNYEAKIWMVKHKKFDYSDLYEAYEKVVTGYNNLIEEGQEEELKNSILGAITIWEKALEEYNPSTKKARINDKAAAAIHLNCAEAYMWLNKYSEAQKHINKVVVLNITKFENRSDKLKAFLKDHQARYKALLKG